VGDAAALQHQSLAIGEFAVGGEVAVGPRSGCAGQAQDGRVVALRFAQRLQGGCAGGMVGCEWVHTMKRTSPWVASKECCCKCAGHGGRVADDVAAVGLAHDVAVGALAAIMRLGLGAVRRCTWRSKGTLRSHCQSRWCNTCPSGLSKHSSPKQVRAPCSARPGP
jgi:hypothetical protein